MLRVATGQCEGVDTHAIIAEVLAECEEQLQGTRPRLGILFVTGDLDDATALGAVAERFPGCQIVGGTSSGTMCAHSGFTEDSISLLLLASDVLSFGVGVGRNCSTDIDAAIDQALAGARRDLKEPERLCIAFPDGWLGDPNLVVERLGTRLADGCGLFGGSIGTTRVSSETAPRQYAGTEIVGDALLLILIAGPVEYSFSLENSWTPVGERQRVTEAQGHDVIRIGDRRALDFYHHYLGRHADPALEFPLAVFDGTSEHYYIRVPHWYDAETGCVMYSGAVPEGATVQLTEAVRSHMIDSTERSVQRAVQGLTGAEPALALVTSCSIRRHILGTEVRREPEMVSHSVPGVPIFGMYAFGEISPVAPGRPSVLHQATLVTLVIGERGQPAPVWTPPAPRLRDTTGDIRYLALKLERSEELRARLEEAHERDHAMLRAIGEDIARSREVVSRQNDELRRLYAELEREKQKSDELLLNILPRDVADELKRTGQVEPVYFESVTVLFTDFKDFSRIASNLSPRALIRELEYYFTAFDRIVERHGLEKLKTIGDAYMCAGGIPTPGGTHALDAVRAAWDIQSFMERVLAERRASSEPGWELRIGIHSGPLMAGVIGNKKFAYDIWGDTVNIAARMESSGEPGRINISRATYERVREHFACEPRGTFAVKNVGEVEMYFVTGPRA